MEKSRVMKKKMIISSIFGFCASGMLTNGFCIYTSLIFNENDDLINRVLFIVNSLLLVVFLLMQSCSTFNKIKKREMSIRHALMEMIRVSFLSILWIIPFWLVWAFTISIAQKI